jgi:redox-sensitive bicupin YhaK (pirin superfamily)
MAAGTVLETPTEHAERAVYVVSGAVRLGDAVSGGVDLEPGQLAILDTGAIVHMRASAESRLMVLGGARFPSMRHLWWNFVASTQERIDAAKERWARGEFPKVPGETEFIPLPRS